MGAESGLGLEGKPFNTPRHPDDNSGAWIIGIIVLVAISIGVWWWAGWGSKPVAQTQVVEPPTCAEYGGAGGVYRLSGCTSTEAGQASALQEFVSKHPEKRITAIGVQASGAVLLITENR
jgi:hypothetical protein